MRAVAGLVVVALLLGGCGGSDPAGPEAKATAGGPTTTAPPTTLDPYGTWIATSLGICEEVLHPLVVELDGADPPSGPEEALALLVRYETTFREAAYLMASVPAPERPGQDLGAPSRLLDQMADQVVAMRDAGLRGEPVTPWYGGMQILEADLRAAFIDARISGCLPERAFWE